MTIAGIIIFIIGIALILITKNQKKIREVASAGRKVPIKNLALGRPIEISGTIETENPIKTPFGHKSCVYYEYELERRQESEENPGQHVWRRVAQNSSFTPFWVKDETGRVKVYPEGAKIEAPEVDERLIHEESNYPVIQSFLNLVKGFSSRAKEKALFLNTPVYILGEAMQGEKEMVIQKGRFPFLISYKSEKQVEKEMERSITILATLGILGLIVGIILIIVGLL